MPNKRSIYWMARAMADEARANRIAGGAAKEIQKMYRRQYLQIIKHLTNLKAELDAGKELSRTQLWNYSRWRQLEQELRNFVQEASLFDISETERALNEVFEKTIGASAAGFDATRMTLPISPRDVIGTTWSGERYSQRIWKNQTAIADRMRRSMEDMLVQGRGLPDIKKAVMKEFDVAFREADRLVRTEAAYVLNRVNMAKYQRAGIRKVEWSVGPEDGKECQICASRGGKIYYIDQAPIIPAHPRCRCIYAGVVELDGEDIPVDGPAADAALQSAIEQKKLQKTRQNGIIDARIVASNAKIPGERHHGKYVDAMNWKPASVKKAIASCERTAQEHIEKIANPAAYDAGWNSKNAVQQNGLLNKWKKDANKNFELAEVMRQVARERGIEAE